MVASFIYLTCHNPFLICHNPSLQDLEEMFPKNPSVVPDMTALHHIHEPGILHNLKERSRPWRQTPYTFMVRYFVVSTHVG